MKSGRLQTRVAVYLRKWNAIALQAIATNRVTFRIPCGRATLARTIAERVFISQWFAIPDMPGVFRVDLEPWGREPELNSADVLRHQPDSRSFPNMKKILKIR